MNSEMAFVGVFRIEMAVAVICMHNKLTKSIGLL